MNVFLMMQRAVDAVSTSLHPDNKIAVHLVCADGETVTAVNAWPPAIAETLGTGTIIGNSSGTVHAEVSALLQARHTGGASVFITDPFCPNCAKNMADGGITSVFIDHKGFTKDFAQRRGGDFTTMSMRIMQKAGIAVAVINRKEGTCTPIHTPAPFTEAFEARPVEFRPHTHGPFSLRDERRHFALCEAIDRHGVHFFVRAFAAPAIGYDYRDDNDLLALRQGDGKYTYQQEPVNRLLFNLRRFGLVMVPNTLVASRTPTARELVNMIGAEINTLAVINPHESRDADGLVALQQLMEAGILQLRTL